MSYFEQRLDLTQVTRSSRFHQGDLCRHTHLVDVSPSICEMIWILINSKMRRKGSIREVYIPKLSSAFNTISNCWNHWISYCGTLMLSWMGVIRTFGLNGAAVWAATYSMLNCEWTYEKRK
jgi:hypothetical protein